MRTRLTSGNNSDICILFQQRNAEGARALSGIESFNTVPRPLHTNANSAERGVHSQPRTSRDCPSSQPLSSRATSFESFHRVPDGSNSPARRGNAISDSQYYDTTHPSQIYEDDDTILQSLTRPYSPGTDDRTLLPTRSNEAMVLPLSPCQNGKDTQNTREMAAHFKAYEDHENISPDSSQGQIRRRDPRIPPPHKLVSKPRAQRCRTTDGLHRTKSSRLPLKRVPRDHHVQNVVLP